MEDVISNWGIIAIILRVKIDFEGLVEDGEDLVIGFEISVTFGDGSKFFDLGNGGETEEALEVKIEDPHILGCHHDEHTLVHLYAEYHMPDIDSDWGYLIQHPMVASVSENEIFVFVEHSDAVPENVDGQFDDEVRGLPRRT